MAELEEHLVPKGKTDLEEEEIIDVTANKSLANESGSLDCDVESQTGHGIEVPAHILRYLYVGHFLGRWGARMWEFSVGLFMLDVWPSSLLLPAVYGVVETASVAIFGPSVGDWIDRTHYVKVLKVLVGLQNLSFIVAGAAVAVLLIYPSSTAKQLNFILLVSLINASGALGALASLGAAILIERDCFGTLMTAALKWKGIQTYVLGLARGVSAIIGISATLFYPMVHSRLQSLRTGLWSIWTQWCILIICVASIWVQNELVSAWMLMGGVAASRLGLWMFDLSVVQQMQDSVRESDRGVVGGVQNSVQSFMDLMTYIMGIIVTDPRDFGVLVLASFLSVTCAAILYSIHTYQVRRHLFHFDRICAMMGMKNMHS